MPSLTSYIIEALVILGVYCIALLISFPVRRRCMGEGLLPHPPAKCLYNLFYRVLRPLVVLALTPAILALCALIPAADAWLSAHHAHVTAWWAFWLVVLVVNLAEGAGVEFYALRGRPFPLPGLLRNILRAALVLAALFMILRSILKVDISSLLASTALLTAVIGFALQGVLGNLLAGMSLHITRSVVPGDWVAIDQQEGEVLDTNWRETRLRTTGGHILMVPNSTVASALIHNMSRPSPLRRHEVNVGASYSDAPGEVIEALIESALSIPEVSREPPPVAILTEYKDFGINYVLRFWTRQYHNRVPVNGEVQRMIWYKFKRRGIEIPFPMSDKLLNDFMDVVYTQRRLESDDRELHRRVDLILASDFGTRLIVDETGHRLATREELVEVARLMKHVRYTRGETLFRQGDPGNSCFIVVAGTLHGRVEHEGGAHAHEFDAGSGTLVGEMSLVTGLPRTATMMAQSEVELLEIPSAAFVRLLGLRPEIPEILSRLVADRVEQNKAAYENLKALKAVNVVESLGRESILRRFLRLVAG